MVATLLEDEGGPVVIVTVPDVSRSVDSAAGLARDEDSGRIVVDKMGIGFDADMIDVFTIDC